jgi:hypothetical protein
VLPPRGGFHHRIPTAARGAFLHRNALTYIRPNIEEHEPEPGDSDAGTVTIEADDGNCDGTPRVYPRSQRFTMGGYLSLGYQTNWRGLYPRKE